MEMHEVAAFLIDTNVWYRWRHDPAKLFRPQARALMLAERRRNLVAVSAISLWELARMAARGRVRIHEPIETWVQDMAGHTMVTVLPITPQIAASQSPLKTGEGCRRIWATKAQTRTAS